MQRTTWIMLLGVACLSVALLLVLPELGLAQSNPWEKPLTDISTSMIGPVALAGFLIALGCFCLMWCMGYASVGVAVGIVVAGAIMGNADSIVTWLGVGG